MEYIKKTKNVSKKIYKPMKAKYNLIDLGRMLTYPRPAGSKMEEKYIKKFIDSVPGMIPDPFGNRYIRIGKKPTTLFASHTDTVHSDHLVKYDSYYDKKRQSYEMVYSGTKPDGSHISYSIHWCG